jgi:UPF0716 family protein affecting phage T7 exclusion
VSRDVKGAIGVILAVALAIALLLGGIALVVSQGMEQTCARNGGVWIAHDTPTGGGATHDRKCQR